MKQDPSDSKQPTESLFSSSLKGPPCQLHSEQTTVMPTTASSSHLYPVSRSLKDFSSFFLDPDVINRKTLMKTWLCFQGIRSECQLSSEAAQLLLHLIVILGVSFFIPLETCHRHELRPLEKPMRRSGSNS